MATFVLLSTFLSIIKDMTHLVQITFIFTRHCFTKGIFYTIHFHSVNYLTIHPPFISFDFHIDFHMIFIKENILQGS